MWLPHAQAAKFPHTPRQPGSPLEDNISVKPHLLFQPQMLESSWLILREWMKTACCHESPQRYRLTAAFLLVWILLLSFHSFIYLKCSTKCKINVKINIIIIILYTELVFIINHKILLGYIIIIISCYCSVSYLKMRLTCCNLSMNTSELIYDLNMISHWFFSVLMTGYILCFLVLLLKLFFKNKERDKLFSQVK